MDDDSLPVIDLTAELDEDEFEDGVLPVAAAPLSPPPPLAVPPVAAAHRRWPLRVVRARRALTAVAVAAVSAVGGMAWSATERHAPPVPPVTKAGDFADRLSCDGGGEPRVRNSLRTWDDVVPLPGSRPLPMPSWLRDRSLGATKIRTAAGAARWSNANTAAAAAFSATPLSDWDAVTRRDVERAGAWMRSWWSRHGRTVTDGWTESTAIAAAREAVLDDRRLTEEIARTVLGTLRWRVLPLSPSQDGDDLAAIGGHRGTQLLEVLVYRRGGDGLLRVQGIAYCDEVRDPVDARDTERHVGTDPPASVSPPVPVECKPRGFEPGPVVVPVDAPIHHGVPPLSPSPSPGGYIPDGHTPARIPPALPDGALLWQHMPGWAPTSPQELVDRLRAEPHYGAPDAVGGRLTYDLVEVDDSQGVATGSHDGKVKVVIDLRRRPGGTWMHATLDSCVADLAERAQPAQPAGSA